MKNEIKIYTNGHTLFTLEDHKGATGTCHPLNITLHSVVDKLQARAMHTKGKLHYIFGIGDRKELANKPLNRKMKFDKFEIY